MGLSEILLIALILALLFGADKLPQLGRALNRARAGLKGGDEIEKSARIRSIAQNLNISVENKSDEQLLKEIEAITRIRVFREK